MGPSSADVDRSSTGDKKRANDDRFDRFASRNEEWIIRLQNLREENDDDEEELLKGSEEDPARKRRLAATRTILHTARLANLHCASEAYREGDCGRTNNACIDRMVVYVQQSFDTEREHHETILENIVCRASHEPPRNQTAERNESQYDDKSITSIDVDAFFEDYPECGQHPIRNDVYCFGESDADSNSVGDWDEQHQASSRRRKRASQSRQGIASITVDLVNAASEPLETQLGYRDETMQHDSQTHQQSQRRTPDVNQMEDDSRQGQYQRAKPLSANNNHGNVDSSSSTAIKNPYSGRNLSSRSQPSSSVARGQDRAIPIDLSTNNDSNDKYIPHRVNSIKNRELVPGQNCLPSIDNARGDKRSHSNSNSDHKQIDPNPYRRNSSQNRSQNIHQGYNNNNNNNNNSSSSGSRSSSNAVYAQQEDSNRNDAWRDHRNQTNPFQTAREVALAEEKYPHRDPFRNNCDGETSSRQPQHSHDKNPYGQEFQGRIGNLPHEDSAPASTSGGPFIPDSLKRKFQRPKRGLGSLSQGGASKIGGNRSGPRPSANTGPRPPANTNSNNGGNVHPRSSNPGYDGQKNQRKSNEAHGGEEEAELPEELQHLDKELVKKIQNEIMESGDKVTFDDIAGLEDAKKTVREVVCWPMKRPDLFTGLRRAPNGLLLYGPPGTGKTLIGKAIAHESGATFFSISSSSLTSKWIGEGEKLVKTLFAVAAYNEPAVIFLDEIDSLLTQRKSTENEASRRIKTEFLVQLDGTGTSGQGRVLIIGATNRPQELDEAARRRFTKRLYIPLPVEEDRKVLLGVLLKTNKHVLTEADIATLARDTDGFSGADLKSLCTDAAMGPIRQLGAKAMDIDVKDVPPISYKHFKRSLKGTRPSVAPGDLKQYIEWDETYGTTRHDEEEEEDSEE